MSKDEEPEKKPLVFIAATKHSGVLNKHKGHSYAHHSCDGNHGDKAHSHKAHTHEPHAHNPRVSLAPPANSNKPHKSENAGLLARYFSTLSGRNQMNTSSNQCNQN